MAETPEEAADRIATVMVRTYGFTYLGKDYAAGTELRRLIVAASSPALQAQDEPPTERTMTTIIDGKPVTFERTLPEPPCALCGRSGS